MNEKSTLRKDANNYFTHKNRGITLIALVITIIVMLILVAVTINMAINGGLFEKAGKATAETKNAIDEEQKLANGAIEIDGVWYNSIDEYLDRQPSNGGEEGNENNNYSVPVSEEDITPANIFNYEILNDGTVATTNLSALPTKTAKITGIKSDYCNKSIYYTYDTENNLSAYYGVAPDKTNTIDTLIIPATAEIDGELYKITDVNLTVDSSGSLPAVKTIIYPNTVENISHYCPKVEFGWIDDMASPVKTIILPNGITSIPDNYAAGCKLLEDIHFPSSVTRIGDASFSWCDSIKTMKLPRGLKYFGANAFYRTDLVEIYIPETLEYVGGRSADWTLQEGARIYYSGSAEQWQNTKFATDRDYSSWPTPTYNAEW